MIGFRKQPGTGSTNGSRKPSGKPTPAKRGGGRQKGGNPFRGIYRFYLFAALSLAAIVFAALFANFGVSSVGEFLSTAASIKGYLLWLGAWGLVTFVFFAYDKHQGMQQAMRVPERILLGLVVIGGVAGGWAGMYLFRHKTMKEHFSRACLFSTLLHALITGALLLV